MILQIVTVTLVAVFLALTLAHALELPGKLRLDKDTYAAVQTIYYPGFTIGAFFGEFGGMAALLALLLLTPTQALAFAWFLAAFGALVAAHLAYWLVTHPVNKFWLRGHELKGAGRAFFGADPLRRGGASEADDWQRLRNRWEYSHVLRAALGVICLVSLVTGVVLG
jgi:hypothetical protein